MSWIKNRIAIVLEKRELNQAYIVDSTNVDSKTVSQWCTGKRDIRIETLASIVKAINMTPMELYMIVTGEEWNPTEEEKLRDMVNRAIRYMRRAIKEQPPVKAFEEDYIKQVEYTDAELGREK